MLHFGSLDRLSPPPGAICVASRPCPSDSGTPSSTDHDLAPPTPDHWQASTSNPGPTTADEPVRTTDGDGDSPRPMTTITHRFAPFDEHLNELVDTPRWQRALDDHFARVFTQSVLSASASGPPPLDAIVTRALEIIAPMSRPKVCGLALAVYAQWVRMQCRHRDANASAPMILVLVSRIARRLGWSSAHDRKDFLDELNHRCVGRIKMMWRWYVAIDARNVLPMSPREMFTQVMAAVAMTGHLFNGGLLQCDVVLDGLRYVARIWPWPDAVATIYAIMFQLGPTFVMEPAVSRFIQRLLADTLPYTVGRVRSDPLRQLLFALHTLVAEWQNRTHVTLYHTHHQRSDQFHAHHSRM